MNLLAADLARAADPVELARSVGPEPHDYQVAVLRSTAKRLLLNWSRQAGKSSATAIIPAHTALYGEGSLTLVVGPGERQAGLLLDKVKDVLDALGWSPTKGEVDNVRYLRLANGSEIYALPGKEGTIRGFSGVDLLVIDEASRVADSLYHAVRPMLAASDGRLVAPSTPFGKRGWWHEAWARGGDGWERTLVPAELVPHISAEFLAQEKRDLPELIYRQEYGCEFVDTLDQVFGYELIQSLLADDVAPLLGAGGGSLWTDETIEPLVPR